MILCFILNYLIQSYWAFFSNVIISVLVCHNNILWPQHSKMGYYFGYSTQHKWHKSHRGGCATFLLLGTRIGS